MRAQATSAAVCPDCGTRLEGGFSRNLGRCMICLLRVGFDDAEEPDETLSAPVKDRLGIYRIERRDDGTHWELGHGAMGVTYRAVDTSLKRPVALKLIDFGVAKALVDKPDAMGLTHGGFVGTPAFASPEQFTDAQVEVRSDIYSLGATLWYVLTGHRPFEGATIEQIRASQHSQALSIEQLKAAHVPSRLISLLVSMLAPEPGARPGVRALTLQLQDCRAQILDRWKAARRLALAAGLIGMAAAAFALFARWHNRAMSQNTAPANISEKSIAVLPFDKLSDDQANAYFAVGIQDEILTSLARVADLKVISRTSVMQYTTGAGRNLREIGKQLGVAHLLEGSVQRAAKRVRVNAQLIDARPDAQ